MHSLARSEAIVNTLRATIHPHRLDDSRLVRELAIVLKVQLAERTGDYISYEDVALPIARIVEAYVNGGAR